MRLLRDYSSGRRKRSKHAMRGDLAVGVYFGYSRMISVPQVSRACNQILNSHEEGAKREREVVKDPGP